MLLSKNILAFSGDLYQEVVQALSPKRNMKISTLFRIQSKENRNYIHHKQKEYKKE